MSVQHKAVSILSCFHHQFQVQKKLTTQLEQQYQAVLLQRPPFFLISLLSESLKLLFRLFNQAIGKTQGIFSKVVFFYKPKHIALEWNLATIWQVLLISCRQVVLPSFFMSFVHLPLLTFSSFSETCPLSVLLISLHLFQLTSSVVLLLFLALQMMFFFSTDWYLQNQFLFVLKIPGGA